MTFVTNICRATFHTMALAATPISSKGLMKVCSPQSSTEGKCLPTNASAVFGMAPDLSGFLTVLGGTIDGDGLTWSIGGPSKAQSLITAGGLLGQPQGISGSHNKYV